MLDPQLILPQLIARRASEQPDRVFIEEVDNGSLTYGQLNDAALRWAAAYRRAGVEPGDRVLTMLPLCLDFYCSAMGLAWILGVEAPINTDYRGSLLVHALTNAQPKVVVIDERFLDRFAEVADELESPPLLVVLGARDTLPDLPYRTLTSDEFLRGGAGTDIAGPNWWDVASIMYTSGTTGPSKGVIMPWGQMYEIATGAYPLETFTEDDAYYLPSVTYHMSAKGVAYTMALVNGRLVIRNRFSVSSYFSDVEKYGCTIATMLGAVAQLMHATDPKPEDADTPLRHVLMSPVLADVEGFMKRFGLQVNTAYGMTEVGPVISAKESGLTNANHTSCGRLMPAYEARIVDEHDFEVPPGEVGELIVRSKEPWTLNLGYFGQPEASTAAWRNGWFHTGDGFRVDTDGNYYFRDRLKDTIRRRGENISSFEVEAIVNSLAVVSESAAVAVPSELGEYEVKIIVVPKSNCDLSEEGLLRSLIPLMPRFMIPRYVEFVDALPKTPTDRIQKVTLRDAGINEKTWDRETSDIEIPV
jgi:crotonobetaine/carnitine-CoA ligase